MDKVITSFDDTKLYYNYHEGQKPLTLIFLHGVGGNWTIWKKEITYFQEQGFSTLALDLRGHGKSDAPDDFTKYQLPHFSRDIHTIVNKEKIKNFSLVGHSLGGGIAINYCMLYPNNVPSSLVLIDSASTYPFDHNRLLNLGPYVTNFLRFIAEHKVTRKQHFFHFEDVDLSLDGIKQNLHLISHLIHLTPLRTIVKTLDNLENYTFKNQPKIDKTLQNLESPTLIIEGRRDDVIPLKFAKLIKKLAKNSELKIINEGTHMIIVEKSEKVNKIIHKFIEKKKVK